MRDCFDIAIVGAGPAGMAAALEASEAGASVVVLDDKAEAGGQIYRSVRSSPLPDRSVLGEDYTRGEALVARFEASAVETIREASVWHVSTRGEVLFSREGKTHSLTAREVMVSTGAMERPFPVPGWHLPGVMTAGSAQVMLKSDGLVVEDAVFVGSGPLLYLIVAQYLRLGVRVRALVDTTQPGTAFQVIPEFLGALKEWKTLRKGLGLLQEIRRSGLPLYRGARDLRVLGETAAEGLSFSCGGRLQNLMTEQVFLHQGVLPNLNLTRALNLEHDWNSAQLSWQPRLDRWGQSSVPNISVAGDGSGIVGADGAVIAGRLVALNQLGKLGYLSSLERDRKAATLHEQMASLRRLRLFLDRLYRPSDELRMPSDPDTMVCRCEEQRLGDLRAGFEQGATDPNALKALKRCGMGPCQGRQCGHTVSELLARWQNKPVAGVGYYRLRSPLRLLSLQEFSNFNLVKPKSSALKDKEDRIGSAAQ
ncbi:FAD/NAD(P)-dependent oxidoreductase [Kiloniella sp. b19]|uniref:FAD/NAD(P)-dependent oxidoreductase n=1 Tax=Kiloniella sp. GXU_MW_B19 TaxID=3141326 RepID=UPI0031D437AC